VQGCGFRDHFSEYRALDVQILGVSFDTVEENAAFAQKFHFPFPLLCDTDRSLGLAYGACTDAEARYANRIAVVIAADGTIAEVHPSVNAGEFPAALLASLQGPPQ